jgi:HTH-like domain
MTTRNIADRHAWLQRLVDDRELLLRRKPTPAGNAGDDFHLRKRLGHGVCLGLCLAPPANAGVRSKQGAVHRLKELASQRRRFGYRRLGLLLARQGVRINRKKLYRLYKEERLTVRKRGGRKRAMGTRAPMLIPQDQNLRWSLDCSTS